MFDRHALLDTLKGLKFLADKDDIKAEFSDAANFQTSLSSAGNTGVTPGSTVATAESNISSVTEDQVISSAWYADQLPPFDITLAGRNEYGSLAVMKILGVELLNEGYGVSIDDIVSEQQFTYVARQVIPWTNVASPFIDEISNATA
jgi:hypothetical protein